MNRRPPERVVFGETEASDEDIVEYGFMPSVADIRRINDGYSVERCSLAASLKLTDGSIDIIVDADELAGRGGERPGDALRLRIGDVTTGNLNHYSSETLKDMKDFFTVAFDLAIDTATREENAHDRLDNKRKGAVPRKWRQGSVVEYNDYLKARVAVNRRVERRARKAAKISKHEISQSEYAEAMESARQGASNEHDQQGHD